jgi:hypothetical protein
MAIDTSSPSAFVGQFKSRITNNVSSTFARMKMQDYIRLVVVIGAYCLLRPYLIKLGGYLQAKDHARPVAEGEHSSPAAVNADSLKDKIGLVESSDEEEEVDEEGVSQYNVADGQGWGTTARRRQRKFIKRMLDEQEKKLAGEDSDDQIKDLLLE